MGYDAGSLLKYDLAGNRTSASLNGVQQASYTYNAANEVTNAGWDYDAAGNLTSDGVTSYGFDALGRLTGTNTSAQTQSYAYNGDGKLVSATANGASASYAQDLAGGMTQILASTSGGATSDYLRDDGAALIASLTVGVRSWYGTDNQGSVRQTLDDSGNVLTTQNYDPYGQPETASQIGSFGYTGELQDGTTGAVDLRARWYQPGTGTLLGVDPMLDTTGQAYAYAGGDPVNGADPSGAIPMAAGTPTAGGSSGPAVPQGPVAAPTPTNSQDAINLELDNVAGSWTSVVGPGPGNAPQTPSEYGIVGTELHQLIGSYYRRMNPGQVFVNQTIGTILDDGFGVHDPRASLLTDRPDILDRTQLYMYEVKPSTELQAAYNQLYRYLAEIDQFSTAGVPYISPGPKGARGTYGVIEAPGGYAVFAAPAIGVILYRYRPGQFRPATQAAAQGTGGLLQIVVGAVDIIVIVGGIIVKVIEGIGSLNPAPSPPCTGLVA